jgi:hypothetical protein
MDSMVALSGVLTQAALEGRNLSTTMRQWVREVTVVAASPVTGSATM